MPGQFAVDHLDQLWVDHLHRYINEFAGRHNVRGLDTIDMIETVAENMAGQRLKYFELFNV